MNESDRRDRLGVRCALLLSCAVAATASPLSSQSPLTADSLRNVLREAAKTSHQIDSLNRLDVPVQEKARQLIRDFTDHNDEPCEYPIGKPEICANYEAEHLDLLDRSAALQKELKTIDTPRRALRLQFGALLTHLRTATYAPAVAAEKDRIVACELINGIAAEAACLAAAEPRARRSPG